jgi:DNA-binding NtrC family response regulator
MRPSMLRGLDKRAPVRVGRRRSTTRPVRQTTDLRAILSQVERAYLLWGLIEARGNRTVAADLLKLPRATFLDRVRHHGLMSCLSQRSTRRLVFDQLDAQAR